MTPADVTLIITGIENLVAYLLQLKSNAQLSDADLDAAIESSNNATRTMIAAFLKAQQPTPIGPGPGGVVTPASPEAPAPADPAAPAS